jgi:hypothetical protein
VEGGGEEEMQECGIVSVKDTGLGREVCDVVRRAMSSYRIACYFPMRSVAVAAVWVTAKRRGLVIWGEGKGGEKGREEWVRRIAGDRVEHEDFVDAVEEIEKVCICH